MSGTYTMQKEVSTPFAAAAQLLEGNRTWKSRGVVFGIAGGLIAPIIGSLLTVISWFADPAWHGVHLRTMGTTLFVFAIPLLILGAHCLDILDKQKQQTARGAKNAEKE
jgi:hypothetical protein